MTTTAVPAAQAPAWATAYTAAALAALPADVTTATPPQVDEVIRTVQLDTVRLGDAYDRALTVIRKGIGHESTSKRVGHGRTVQTVTVWPTSKMEAIAEARALPADQPAAHYSGADTVGEALAAFDAVCEQMREAHVVETRMIAEFARRGGWARYYRVHAANGHVHTETTCRNTYATTLWTWPTQLSGADGAMVVEAAGALTCLTCFPDEREEILRDRPVRFDAFETPEQRDERVRRETALAERNAAKIAKGVTPDGSPLQINMRAANEALYGSVVVVRTERAAELRYIEFAANVHRERYDAHQRAGFAQAAVALADALAWKQGLTRDAIEEKYADKIGKKLNDPYG